jgi:hypothetical protein
VKTIVPKTILLPAILAGLAHCGGATINVGRDEAGGGSEGGSSEGGSSDAPDEV